MMKKTIWSILALVLCFATVLCMAACGNQGDEPADETTAASESETEAAAGDTSEWFNEDGSFKYAIIRADAAATKVGSACANLRKVLADAFGIDLNSISIGTDWVNRGESVPEGTYEIMVGATNRPEDDAYVANLKEGEVMIVAEGTKIMLLGEDDNAAISAVKWFISNYINKNLDADGHATFGVPSGTLYDVAPDLTTHIVTTVYPTTDVIVADIDLSGANAGCYGIDDTGVEDCTTAIQNALNQVSALGGGTVYLGAGKYRITGQIKIPAYCTLRGDWQDPDVGTDYGTIIIADVTESTPALFLIGGSAGVNGLTVYYPNQSLTDVKKYDFTFYTTGQGDAYMLASVTNCTVINGYQGIGACVYETNAHEQFTIDNVKGTFLRTAAEVYNQADVGTWKLVTVSPKYWAESPLNETAVSLSDVTTYMRKNTTGLILGDLEWTEFAGLYVTSCKTGIDIVAGKRIEFAGSLYDAQVTECDVALRVESIDSRWGMTVTNSTLSGSSKSIYNTADGVVKLSNTTLTGSKSGSITDEGDNSASDYQIDYTRSYTKPASNLYVFTGDNTGKVNVSATLQALLDEAGKTGGVVYLPAGYYLLKEAITVPEGVELRGASGSPNRETGSTSGGTVIMSRYGDTADYGPTSQALITLGAGAGVNGIRICYGYNGPLDDDLNTSYVIRGTGDGVYCVNCSIAAAAYGVDFSGCDNHFIKKLSSLCYYNAMNVGGDNGIVEGCLQNGTVLCRITAGTGALCDSNTWLPEGQVFDMLFNPITRPYTAYLTIAEGSGELVYNTFAYGPYSLVTNNGGTDAMVISVGSDNIGGVQTISNSGSMTVLGCLRYNGESIEYHGGTLKVFTRLTIGDKEETPYTKG